MKSGVKVVIAALLLLVVCRMTWLLSQRDEFEGKDRSVETIVISAANAEPARLGQADEPVNKVNSEPHEMSESSGKWSVPSQNQLRAEAEQNLHSTPASLIEFAEQIGSQLEEARLDPIVAVKLIKVLGECTLNSEDASLQSKTLCLQSARRLNEIYKGRFAQEYRDIRSRADSAVISLQDGIDPQQPDTAGAKQSN